MLYRRRNAAEVAMWMDEGIRLGVWDLCPSTLCAKAYHGDLIFGAALSLLVCQRWLKDSRRQKTQS